jgi:hypothetical protein
LQLPSVLSNAARWIVGDWLGFRRAAGTKKTVGEHYHRALGSSQQPMPTSNIKIRHVDCIICLFESPTDSPSVPFGGVRW